MINFNEMNLPTMKKLVLSSLTILFSFSYSLAQTTVYSENFDGATTWTLNTDIGAEDSNPNQWYISCEEAGMGDGVCGDDCIASASQTLHVSTDPGIGGDLGAAYVETGFSVTGTDRRAESGDINTTGFTSLTLEFEMIGYGGNANDYCELFYSTDGGVAWTSLDPSLTSLCCGGVTCTGAEQGLWQTNTYALPASCEGITNLRISFVWKNLDDGIATDPSFAVDNITITSPDAAATPTAEFTLDTPTTICAGDVITFTDASSGGTTPYTYNWTFPGGAPATAATVGPHAITFATPGSYDVVLEITDAGALIDDTTVTVTVLDCTTPTASFTMDIAGTVICAGDDITFTDNSFGGTAPYTYNWTFPGGTPGTAATAGPHVVNFATPGSYNVVLEITDGGALVDDTTVTITVNDCSSSLIASFIPDATSICVGDCIGFTDNSTGTGIIGWGWTFSDATIPPAAGADPGTICFNNAGLIDVTLTITDGAFSDDTTITIDVRPLPAVGVIASPNDTICDGDQVTLNGSGAASYTWDLGVTDGVPFIPPSGTTTYTVTGTDAIGCVNTATVDITTITCIPLVAGFEYADNNCVGECITLTDTSSGNIISWNWDFGGAATPNTSTEQNPTICFNSSGVFNIQLTVTDLNGDSESITNPISVFDSPTVTAEIDTIIDLGGQAELIAYGDAAFGSYLWSPNDDIDCDTCSSTYANPSVVTEYIVTHTDINGCSATDTMIVYVNFIEGLGVPKAFSPNGDGNNDVLYVLGYGIESMQFSVYNRYGQLMFVTSDQNIGWDGIHNGREANPGVFTWVLEYTLLNGSTGILKGNTTLVR